MPVQNQRLRVTGLPPDQAKRLVYRTRRMLADDDPKKRQPLEEGDEFEAPPSDAETYLRAGWVEPVDWTPERPRPHRATAGAKKKSEAAVNRRQSPRQQQSEPRQSQPSPSPQSSEESAQESQSRNQEQAQSQPQQLEEMTRAELLELAEKHGVELPAGYVAHGELVEALKNAGVSAEG
jgi:FtsZ-interacting cell division protein ZipA